MLYLSDADLEGLAIPPADLANTIEDALRAKAEGRLHVAPKSAILPGGGRYMMSTLAVGDDGYIVVKQVTVSPENPARGLPSINGAIMVLDAETGLARGFLGANWITAHRTAALSAVAARRLAPKNAQTIAFVGTGVQARSHLAAFREMFPLREVLAFGRGRANLGRLHETADGLSFRETEAEEALRTADIVVTSITLDYTVEPFLDARWLKPTAFAAITDLCIPWTDEGMSAFGTLVVDDRAQERESDTPMVPYESIDGDLSELVAGSVTLGEGPAAFAFRGIALGDYAAAVLALRRAEASGAGLKIGE